MLIHYDFYVYIHPLAYLRSFMFSQQVTGNLPLNDLINIRQDGNANFQVYINNANDNGEIRFYTKNAMNINDYNYSYLTFSYSEPRLTYNTKINKDGILQYYHSLSRLKPKCGKPGHNFLAVLI